MTHGSVCVCYEGAGFLPVPGGEVERGAPGDVLVVGVGSSLQQQDQTLHGAAATEHTDGTHRQSAKGNNNNNIKAFLHTGMTAIIIPLGTNKVLSYLKK